MKYRVKGTISYTVTVTVDEELEADSPDDAEHYTVEDHTPLVFAGEVDWDDSSLEVTSVADEGSIPEDIKMWKMGMPTLFEVAP
jgi:hypothetical protein